MTGLIKIADSVACPSSQIGVTTVDSELATSRCYGVATGQPCRVAGCLGFALREIEIEHRTLQKHLTQMGERFNANMKRRGLEPLSELWVHGPFPSKDLLETMTDPDSSSTFGKMARRIPDPTAGGMPVEHPELTLPAVFETVTHKSDYVFIGWFRAYEQTIATRAFWTGDRSGVERIPIGAEA